MGARRPWLILSLMIAAACASPAAASERKVALPGGRIIALDCRGRGTFTVLLEPGDGGRRSHMIALVAALSPHYRVCSYDRRNVGGSSAAPVPRKAADLAADAADALAAAGERGPLLLFGSSMGGLLVRAYAARYPVAGFVTGNQPGTAREWMRFAGPAMTPAQRAADAAWLTGDNQEQIDVVDVSRTIERAPAPAIPRIVMISTERYQCPRAGICGALYRAFVAGSTAAARAGRGGHLRIIDGDHDLYTTHLAQVVAAIDAVAAAAAALPSHTRR